MTEPDLPQTSDPDQPVTQSTANRLIAAINALRETLREQLTAWRPTVEKLVMLATAIWLAFSSWQHGTKLDTIDQKADTAADKAKVAADNTEQTKKIGTAVVQTLADQTGDPKAVEAAKEATAATKPSSQP